MLAMRQAQAAAGGLAVAAERAAALVAPGSGAEVLALVRRMLAATDAAALLPSARCSDATDTLEDAPMIRAPRFWSWARRTG